ncbi:MAG: UDP-N-acetylmuramoyl-tripeptide--D-alanyl-D-alanine ligase [Aestuariivita sp.]|nr:UDP-N-acetylmuramoyl-tripeptide--D-alanyl-D-alanine ligase [Aestuariivita sp.]MCY4202399.1 UDP-N-acetylmuramoyl-tripeptide--D-alanyl-D-alanine ligase [Aestuariivita sp.]
MTLWTAQEAAAATSGTVAGDWSATGVSIDTRKLVRGDLFVALTDKRDGHDFVRQALIDGASAAMVSRVPASVKSRDRLLIVDDVQKGLEALGRIGRERSRAKVCAITGSVGKTSCKEMMTTVLAEQGKVSASVASYNNQWGVPLTLARIPPDADFAVIEIGMNKPGEISPLACLARPHVALITTVGAAHLEEFADEVEIALEKARIFDGLEPNGTAVINADTKHTTCLRNSAQARSARIVDFGRQARDFCLLDTHQQDDFFVARAHANGNQVIFKLATQGVHFVTNALGVIAASSALGADIALVAQAMGRWSPGEGRGQVQRLWLRSAQKEQAFTLIDDCYNANPVSMGAALELLVASAPTDLSSVWRGRKIALLGDMAELGADGPQFHTALAHHPAMEHIDIVHCVGPLTAHLHEELPKEKRGEHFENAAQMAAWVGKEIAADDVVLVKASLMTGLRSVVDAIQKLAHREKPMDE